MHKLNRAGAISGLAVVFVLTLLLLIGAIIFGVWAYSSRSNYKNHTQNLIDSAVASAKQGEDQLKNQQFAQAEKNPLKTYNGPSTYGSLVVNFPKTWSAYVDDSGQGSALVDGYFYPGVVPSIINQTSDFALRVQVIGNSYSQTVSQLNSEEQQGLLQAAAYSPPKVPNVVGLKVTGQVSSDQQKQVTMIVLPLRAYTIELWTEGSLYLSDFNNYVLPNFSFSP